MTRPSFNHSLAGILHTDNGQIGHHLLFLHEQAVEGGFTENESGALTNTYAGGARQNTWAAAPQPGPNDVMS